MKRLSDYVGNTPLIPIKLEDKTIWGKAELMNPLNANKCSVSMEQNYT